MKLRQTRTQDSLSFLYQLRADHRYGVQFQVSDTNTLMKIEVADLRRSDLAMNTGSCAGESFSVRLQRRQPSKTHSDPVLATSDVSLMPTLDAMPLVSSIARRDCPGKSSTAPLRTSRGRVSVLVRTDFYSVCASNATI